MAHHGEEAEGANRTIHTIAYEVDTQSQLKVLFYIQYKDGYEDDGDIFEYPIDSVKFDHDKVKTL